MFGKLNIQALSGLGSLFRMMDWNQVKEEIEQENRARIVIVGAGNAGKSTLLNQLKGWTVSRDAIKIGEAITPQIEDLGFFVLIDLPSHWDGNGNLEAEPHWGVLLTANLVLFVFDAVAGLRYSDYEWFARIRGAGKATLAVLNKCDQVPNLAECVRRLSQQLGMPVIPISARYGTDVRTLLLPRIVEAQPSLATALGREVVGYRHITAQRVTRRAAMVCALLGTEPIPLLDIPFQAFAQTQMILRIASIYGQPTGDRYSRELLMTFSGSALLRYLAQQLGRLVPFGGLVISAVVAGAGTWSLGQAAIAYFERRTNPNNVLNTPIPRRRMTIGKLMTRIRMWHQEKAQWIGMRFSSVASRRR